MTLPLLLVFLAKIFLFFVVGLRFFRKPKPNLMWALTAVPFVVNAALLVSEYLRPQAPAIALHPRYELVRALAAVLCVGAISLYMLTIGTHRVALPAWHQPDQRPDELVMRGPYRLIRHPFYSSYVIYFTASVLLAPTLPVVLNAIVLFTIITLTAMREEQHLLATFGPDYQRYLAHTGRFFPRFARTEPS